MKFGPAYAEMHYKFKLPWSLLYKNEPEILVDAPFEIVPAEPLKLFIVIREAHRFPVFIESLSAKFSAVGAEFEKTFSINESANGPFRFIEVDCGKIPAGKYQIDTILSVQIGKKKKRIRRFNLTGLKPSPLKVHVLAHPIPKPKGFIAGDTHVHTYISADPVEFGASPAVLQAAAKAVGLDFIFCTDHSYDFAFGKENYMIRADAQNRFDELKSEIATLPEYPRLIAGEEISAGNARGQNVHMLCPGDPKYIPGEGDCGRKWLDNAPTLSIEKILSMTSVPCIAAHPKERMGKLERFIFRRGDWHAEDLHRSSKNPIRALEFWNGSRDGGFFLGRKLWISELEGGNFILPLGGNDAHGDLNEYTGVKIPLFKLKKSDAHVFGKVRTVFCGNDPVKALFQKNLYVTDGPALWWERSEGLARFHFLSSPDFGRLKALKFFAQTLDSAHEAPIEIPAQSVSAYEAVFEISLEKFRYVRAEAETDFKKFALTSACPAQPDNART